MEAETIFALASGGGVAGVAVVRISGPRAREALERFCGGVPPSRKAALRSIVDPRSGREIDSGLILFFPGPASFTGEDVVELQVHGSRAIVRELLGCLGDQPGFRAAAAGEFTERAFRNGKMDLLDVEALGDLLEADSIMQARFAREAQARLRVKGQDWRRRIIELRALTEAYIDFSDEDDITQYGAVETAPLAAALAEELSRVIATFEQGERMRHGLRVAILGAPNAGKSSLLNALARRDAAIVSSQAGTTRDVVEIHLVLGGYPVVLWDTAGLREAADLIEREGVRRALQRAAEADLKLWLSAADDPQDPLIDGCLVVVTKADLIDSNTIRLEKAVVISTETKFGIDRLIALIEERASAELNLGDDIMVAHERQRSRLIRARDAVLRYIGIPVDALELRSEELRHAEAALESLVGRVGYEDVLGEIFSRFCIGK
ncbi:MAG TPA: tRNA uridine-5-carboxymethylaminomethyl(34) synthesis GTPase MnmE [Rhabdaerophilum sp.]|nr:tRNA uridine-5-carboxymethylaminomethyl(34) synthesis GTPase MnmE [Rhabdaerophilum sp.]